MRQTWSKWIKAAGFSLGFLVLATQLSACGKKSDLTLPEQQSAALPGFSEPTQQP